MQIIIYFIVLGLLESCGSSSGSDDNAAPAAQDNTPSTSYYVASASQLVECNDKSRGFLAYVQDSSKFMACVASGWSEVNVKGKDGSNGKDGAAGTSGSSGTAGATTMVSGNQWYDTQVTKMWVMTNVNTSVTGFTDAQTSCSGAYRIPTATEAQVALGHGMGVMAQAMTSAPTYIMIANISVTGKAVRITDGVYMVPVSGTAAQFCIAQ